MKETMRERYEKIVERSREKRRHRLTIGVIGSVAAIATAAALAMPAIAAVQGQFDDPAAVTEQTVEQPTEQPDLTTMAVPSEESSAEKNVEQPTSEEAASATLASEPSDPAPQSADNSGISTLADIPGEHVDGGTFMGSESNELTWELTVSDAGEYTLAISGEGKMPDYANDTDKPWYNYNGRTLSVAIGDGITYIGTKNFNGMHITSIKFGSSVEVIGSRSFDYNWATINQLEIPGNVKTIETEAFVNDSITELILHEGLEKVEGNAFGWGSNTSTVGYKVDVPSTLTSIAVTAFGHANYYDVDESNPVYSSDELGILYSKDGKTLIDMPAALMIDEFTVPEGVETLGEGAIKGSAYVKLSKEAPMLKR